MGPGRGSLPGGGRGPGGGRVPGGGRTAGFTQDALLIGWAAVLCMAVSGGVGQARGPAAEEQPLLVDKAHDLGVDFVHRSGAIGRLLLPEIMGSGVALFDYDRDGDLDMYLVQGGELVASLDASVQVAPEARTVGGRLFRNELVSKNGVPDPSTLRFADVTSAAKLAPRGYGQGVAVADVNGDGWQDLYLTNVGANELWLNREGTFSRVASGAEDAGWSTSATFFDADNDSDLDLFVTNYTVWSVATTVTCFATNSRRDYCGPQSYPPAVDGFFLNEGDGTFVAAPFPVFSATPGAGLGVVALDANGDRLSDLFVANDGMANRLWLYNGDSWRDDGLLSGVAVNGSGSAEASMGVAVGDVDQDGDLDVFLTHLVGETDTLLMNQDGGLFADRTVAAGLGGASVRQTSFGTAFVDLDADGDLDIAIASGGVRLGSASGEAGVAGLGQPNRLLRNSGLQNGTPSFGPWPQSAAPTFALQRVSRGLAHGDLDNDGDPDLVITNVDGPVEVLINTTQPRDWLGLDLTVETSYSAPLLGWQVIRRSSTGQTVAEVRVDGSYLSSSDPRIRLVGVEKGETLEVVPRFRKEGGADWSPITVTQDMIGRYVAWSPPKQ